LSQLESPPGLPAARYPEGRPENRNSEYAHHAAPQGLDPHGRSARNFVSNVRARDRIMMRGSSARLQAVEMPPQAAQYGGWRQPLNGGHRRQSLSPPFNNVPDCYVDVFVVLACVRLRGLAPAPVEQDGGGCHARCVLVAVAHDSGKRAHGLSCIRPAQRPDVRWYSLCWQRVYGVDTPSCWRGQTRIRHGDNHANNLTQHPV
jgi:hypothetical protein